MAVPTRCKKRLGSYLMAVRQRAGRTTAEAAVELKQDSPSTMNRYEAGEVLPNWGTVRTLLDYYGATKAERDQASRLWDDARVEPRSVRLPSMVPKAFRKLVNAEQREAVQERVLAPYVLPALLQTERYARALVQAAHRFYNPATRQGDVVAARMKRQKPLEGPDPLALHVLIDEAVVQRKIGGPDVHREQLARLLLVAEKPNITLQVITFGVGAYGTMNGSCVIVDYPEPDAVPGVYLEYPAGGAWVEDPEDVQRFTNMFDDVSALALSPADSTDLIHRQLRELAGA
ncbi:MAG TPA: helix-turn-helix transcriptional regulator [Actinophytocola sp.]|uniref:helix-turn-helix domain-containing protein n=1 Tax=Actinophytocola sp. TaxID=1872138 RepID=UPI002DDD1258|nr:helix-turn-helix transcriptional regulator [Actinophytocola sp.]HEV2779232.1 helix-turn-helix transcriptional regulator [Actinophytocola sp.]